jgi:hypothetical protein
MKGMWENSPDLEDLIPSKTGITHAFLLENLEVKSSHA